MVVVSSSFPIVERALLHAPSRYLSLGGPDAQYSGGSWTGSVVGGTPAPQGQPLKPGLPPLAVKGGGSPRPQARDTVLPVTFSLLTTRFPTF